MSSVPAPRIALMNGSATVNWSNGIPFNGFLLVELVPPSDGTTQWAEVDYGNLYPGIRLPLMQVIPIVNGQFNTSCGLFVNADLVPPNSSYQGWYYDTTKRQISSIPNFTVTSNAAFTPQIPLLPAPTTTGAVTSPDA